MDIEIKAKRTSKYSKYFNKNNYSAVIDIYLTTEDNSVRNISNMLDIPQGAVHWLLNKYLKQKEKQVNRKINS